MSNILSLDSLDFNFFTSSSVLYCDFNSLPVKNFANGELFVPLSGSSGSIEDGRFDSALRLDKNMKLAYSGELKVSSQMTFSFWLNSVNHGVVYDQIDPNVYYNVKVPVFGKTSWSISKGTQNFTINSGSSFLVYEKCYEDGDNSIVVEFYNSFGTYRRESERYKTGINHHFYIIYNGIEGFINIYVDGINNELISTSPVGYEDTPQSISDDPSNAFIINDIAPGVTSSVVGSGGLMDDLFICNAALNNEVLIKKIINRGIADVFITNSGFGKNKQSIFLPYNEVSTNYLKSVSGNSAEICLGSSYGDIFKGSSTRWAFRKKFSNQNEVGDLKAIKYEGDGLISFSATDGVTILGYGVELE